MICRQIQIKLNKEWHRDEQKTYKAKRDNIDLPQIQH
jgi:hypothetical protein